MAHTCGELLKIPYLAAFAEVIRSRDTEPPDILLSLPIQRIQNSTARLTCSPSWRESSLNAAELLTRREKLLADLGVEAPLAL